MNDLVWDYSLFKTKCNNFLISRFYAFSSLMFVLYFRNIFGGDSTKSTESCDNDDQDTLDSADSYDL